MDKELPNHETAGDRAPPITKCKHIATLEERMAMSKSNARPDLSEGANGDMTRPRLESIAKSLNTDPIKLSAGADFKKIIENDWENYRRVRGIDKNFIS